MKPFRKAVFDCIDGNITYASIGVIPVYDEKVHERETTYLYVLLSTQTERDVTDQDCYWQTDSSIEILIISKTGSEVSKDAVDDISQKIYDLLLTLPGSNLLGVQSGFQIVNLKRQSAVSGRVEISPTQSELQKILNFTAGIYHS